MHFISAGDINGPPDKPLPREPSSRLDATASSPQANSTSLSNNVHKNAEGVFVPGESASDGENSFQTVSPPSSPET